MNYVGTNTNNAPLIQPLSFLRSGRYYYSDGSHDSRGSYGFYWSSTSYTNTRAYDLYFNSGTLNYRYDRERGNGFTVRCGGKAK